MPAKFLVYNGNTTSTAKLTFQQRDGNRYITCPVTLIVEGVLPGNQGPLLYSREGLERYASDWDGIPLVVDHPKDGMGQHTSARKENAVGFVHNPKVTHNKSGKFSLQAHAWIEQAKLKSAAPKLLSRLLSGKPLEVSTGLYSSILPREGTYNGQRYIGVVSKQRPDHLALLTTEQGACSIKDGCGVLLNSCCAKCALNANPQGCNQHTGPGCGGGGNKSDKSGKAKGNKAAKSKGKATTKGKKPAVSSQEKEGAQAKSTSPAFKVGSKVFVPKGTTVGDTVTHRTYAATVQAVVSDEGGGNRYQISIPSTTGRTYKGVVDESSLKEVGPLMTGEEKEALKKEGNALRKIRGPRWPYHTNSRVIRSLNTGRFKRKGSGTGFGEFHEKAQSGALIVDSDCEERGKHPKLLNKSVEDEDKWERAKSLADKAGKSGNWGYVAAIYKGLGGTFKGGSRMKKNVGGVTRNQAIKELLSDPNWVPSGTKLRNARKILESMSDAMLLSAYQNTRVANALREVSITNSDGDEILIDRLSNKSLRELLNAKLSVSDAVEEDSEDLPLENEDDEDDEDDEDWEDTENEDYEEEEDDEEEEDEEDVENARDSAGYGWNNDQERKAAVARMMEDGDWDGGEASGGGKKGGGGGKKGGGGGKKGGGAKGKSGGSPKGKSSGGKSSKGKPAKASGGKKTRNSREWLEDAPPEIRQVVENAMANEREQRINLIRKIVSTTEGTKARKVLANSLLNRPIRELQLLANSVREQTNRNETITTIFGPVSNSWEDDGGKEYDDVLDLPDTDKMVLEDRN